MNEGKGHWEKVMYDDGIPSREVEWVAEPQPSTDNLTFSQARDAMKQGKVITRAGWEWRYEDKRLEVRMVGDKSWGQVTSINGLHIRATDWRIVEEAE